MKKNFLNDLYDQYSQGLMDKKQFESLIIQTIHRDLKYYNLHKRKKDSRMDYLSWLYPRLSRAIDAYNKNGATFESYIITLIRWSSKEYSTRHYDREIKENAVWAARYSEMFVHEEEPDYCNDIDDQNVSDAEKKEFKNPRQLLILILKCYYYISDDLLDRLAPRIGIEKSELREMIDNLRKQRIDRDEAYCIMRANIHSQYYRCIVYEKKLRDAHKDSKIYAKIEFQLQKSRQRLECMRKRLARLRMEATNTQIAQLLGISKGTVDSSLHILKTKPDIKTEVLSASPADKN